ncbi:MAG TPA: 50S ribosomal protein L9 [Thermoanaerobaculia bacterium]|nr:50S ribosomal protein L9 [Thermoanaerobaculia bacterium]
MRVILLKDHRHLGRRGEEVDVKPGFGRNFLLPQGLALLSSDANRKYFDEQRDKIEAEHARERDQAQAIADKLEGLRLEIAKKAGETETLYGSVTATEVAERLEEKIGIEVDRRRIDLEGGIKTLGEHEVRILLHSEVTAVVTVVVVPEE